MDSPAAALLDDDTFWQYLDLILNGHEGLVPAVVAHHRATIARPPSAPSSRRRNVARRVGVTGGRDYDHREAAIAKAEGRSNG